MALFASSGLGSASVSRRGSLHGSLHGTLNYNLKGSTSRLSTYSCHSRHSLDLLAVSGRLAYAKFEVEERESAIRGRGYVCGILCSSIKRLWRRLTMRIGGKERIMGNCCICTYIEVFDTPVIPKV